MVRRNRGTCVTTTLTSGSVRCPKASAAISAKTPARAFGNVGTGSDTKVSKLTFKAVAAATQDPADVPNMGEP
jgi:hypothetical protein